MSEKRFGGHTLEELKNSALPDPDIVDDEDNPFWTPEDWKNAQSVEEMDPEILALFPRTKLRGPQKSPTKVPVSLRLSREVVDHYKATGDGWQTRIDDALKQAIKKAG